jgi:hypothetical protein
MTKKRRATISLLVLASFMFVRPAWSEAPVKGDWQGRRLSITAEETPLSVILQEVTRRTGLEMRGHERLQRKVSLRFEALSLRAGLQRLLTHVNHVILEGPGPTADPEPLLIVIFDRGEEPSLAPTQHPTFVQEWKPRRTDDDARGDALLDDPDPGMRRRAVERLRETGDRQTLGRLMDALADDNAGVREAAIANLDQHGEAAIEPVRALLSRETAPEVLATAARVLGHVGGNEGVDLLWTMLQHPDRGVRITAVEALGSIGHPAATDALMVVARGRDPVLRMAALDMLAFRGECSMGAVDKERVDSAVTLEASGCGRRDEGDELERR